MNILPKFYLILIITHDCNLNCRYCYLERRNSVVSTMDYDVIEKSINFVSSLNLPFHIQITGGEPTTKPKLIEYICSFIRKNNISATIGIQTNATLIDSAMVNILKKYNIQIGVSIDGPLDIQEMIRGNAALSFKGIKLLCEKDLEFRITTVLTNLNILRLKELALLISQFKTAVGIGFDMLVKKGRAIKNKIDFPSVDNLKKGITEFLQALYWVNGKRTYPIKLREQELISKNKKSFFCYAQKGISLAVTPEGSLYPCAQTVGDRRFFLGDIFNVKSFVSPLVNIKLMDNRCVKCEIFTFCPGDCPSRLYYNNFESKNLMCTMYKILFNWVRRKYGSY